MNNQKKVLKVIEKLIDPCLFLLGVALYFILSPTFDGTFNVQHIFIPIIVGSLIVGIARIILPYSRSSNKERILIDQEFLTLVQSAFTNQKRNRRNLYKALQLYHNNQFMKAIDILDILFQKSVKDADKYAVCYLSGLCNYELSLFDYAIDDFDTCLDVKITTEVLTNIGNCHLRMYRDDEAKSFFIRALKINNSDIATLYGMAEVEARCGDYLSSLSYAEMILKQSEHSLPALIYAGLACAILKNGKEDEFLKRIENISLESANELRKNIKKLQ